MANRCPRSMVHRPGAAISVAAVVGTLLAALSGWAAYSLCVPGGCWAISTSFCEAIGKSPPWTLLAGIAAGPALLLTWFFRTAHKNEELSQAGEKLRADETVTAVARFREATGLLENELVMNRIAGLLLLESVARDQSRLQRAVLDTICTHLRVRGRRHIAALKEGVYMDLRPADRPENVTLEHVAHNFDRYQEPEPDLDEGFRVLERLSDLQDAVGLDLRGTIVVGRNLSRLPLRECDLSDSIVALCDAASADMRGVRALRAYFYEVTFSKADLRGATLDGSGFSPTAPTDAVIDDKTSGIVDAPPPSGSRAD